MGTKELEFFSIQGWWEEDFVPPSVISFNG